MASRCGRFRMFLALVLLGPGGLWADEVTEASRRATGDAGERGGVEWVRADGDGERLRWGVQGRLIWGLAPPTGRPTDGPRGLIRLYYPTLPDGQYDLINFIAVEPIARGVKGFSELEQSQLDNLSGKRFWVAPGSAAQPTSHPLGGRLTRLDSGTEELSVDVLVEPFVNGAHVRLTITQRSDSPDEIRLTIHAQPDSAPIDYCILTATMGNKSRARQLWLRDRVVSSLDLYSDYRKLDFAPHRTFALEQLHRTATDDLLVAITTDESQPAAVEPFPQRVHWYYGGFAVTQYWKKPAGTWREDVQVAVNGRYTYWLSRRPIPGGVSFENFELRERFHDGQCFIFGMTRKPPPELGLPLSPSPELCPHEIDPE